MSEARPPRNQMSATKKLMAVGISYPLLKLPVAVVSCIFPSLVAQMGSTALQQIVLWYCWLLAVAVASATIAWVWNGSNFRWLGVIIFMIWMLGIAFAETVLLVGLAMGQMARSLPT